MLFDGRQPLATQNLLLRVQSGISDIRSCASFPVRLIQADHLAAAFHFVAAGMVYSQVGGDAIKPGSELGFRRIAFARAVNPQENLLRQLLRSSLVMAHAVHESDHRPVIFGGQIFESSSVIRSGAKHYLRVSE